MKPYIKWQYACQTEDFMNLKKGPDFYKIKN